VAEQLQVTEWSAEVLPEEKAERVSEWQAKGHTVLMIGDGVNDALALQRANVGIAMGARLNEAALGGADIALMDEALENIPALLALSERVAQCQQQNVLIGLSWSGLLFGLVIMGYISPCLLRCCTMWAPCGWCGTVRECCESEHPIDPTSRAYCNDIVSVEEPIGQLRARAAEETPTHLSVPKGLATLE